MKAIERAISYVRDNKTWDELADERALRLINEFRCDIMSADPHIATEIYDLMEEWSEANGYPSEWWLDECCEDDVFMQL